MDVNVDIHLRPIELSRILDSKVLAIIDETHFVADSTIRNSNFVVLLEKNKNQTLNVGDTIKVAYDSIEQYWKWEIEA